MTREALAARIGELHVAALLERGRLIDLRLDDPARAEPRPGEIRAARVERAGAGGVFLDLGGQSGFLPDAEGLAPGDRLLVEITRGPEGAKAARAERKLTFRGRFMAHTPDAPGVNLSRRLAEPAERDRLSAAVAASGAPGGFVLRTHAAGAESAALTEEAARLAAQAEELAGAALDPPRRLRAALDPLAQLAWDWAPGRSRGGFEDPAEGAALFESLGLFETIDALLEPRVALGEGWMSMERTQALVAIDVNSGGGGAAAANLLAAAEIPRQLRLRGWGGMVLIDFASAAAPDRARIAEALRRAADAPLRPLGWGPLGLMEARRRRDRPALESVWRRG